MTEDTDRQQAPPIPGELLDMIDRVRLRVGDLLEDLIAEVEAARTVPLSNSVMVPKLEFAEKLQNAKTDLVSTLDDVVEDLPEELRAARWMVRERESYVARTNEKARDLVARARARAEELVSDSHVVAEAVEEANRLVRNAETEARRIRLEGEDHAEQRLGEAEQILGELLTYLRESRSALHQSLPPAPEVPISE